MPYIQFDPMDKRIKHGFFGKNTLGTHEYICKNNCSEQHYKIISNNREIIANELEIKNNKLSILNQVHGNKVAYVDRLRELNEEIEADAQITNIRNIALAIITADCVPILFFDHDNEIIGAAHAGWKGARYGVIENTLDGMRKLGADKIEVIIGPCIHQESYEVSQDFYKTFLQESENNSYFFTTSTRGGYYMFNLPAYVISKLENNNVKFIYNINRDTLAEPAIFYSHRRSTLNNTKRLGSNLSVITIC
jgi:polyphenol oxidase